MGGSLRNKQLMRIAAIVGVFLLVVYLYFSWRSDIKGKDEKIAAAGLEYNELLAKFNKLTDELKRNVQRSAETRHELERAQKSKEMEISKKDQEIRQCREQMRETEANLQSVETERDRLKSVNSQLEQEKHDCTAEQERLNKELASQRLTFQNENENAQKCASELQSIKSQLLSAQTDNFKAGQRLQECQTQLTTAQDAFSACQSKTTSLETDIRNKASEISQLQAQLDILKQQQQLSLKQSPPIRQSIDTHQQTFNDINISDDQKKKTLETLQQKLSNNQVLSPQEQQVLQMLNKNGNPVAAQNQRILPPGDNTHLTGNQEGYLGKESPPEGNSPPSDDQQAPPPKPGVPPQLHNTDEEQVEDLVDEEKRKENLDGKEDDFEGGADGGDQGPGDDPQDYQRAKQGVDDDFEEKVDDFNDKEEDKEVKSPREANPLPHPVGQGPADADFEVMHDPDGHEAFRMDQEHYKKERKDRRKHFSQEEINKLRQRMNKIPPRGRVIPKHPDYR